MTQGNWKQQRMLIQVAAHRQASFLGYVSLLHDAIFERDEAVLFLVFIDCADQMRRCSF